MFIRRNFLSPKAVCHQDILKQKWVQSRQFLGSNRQTHSLGQKSKRAFIDKDGLLTNCE